MAEVSLEERRRTYRAFLVGMGIAFAASAVVLVVVALIFS